MLRQLHKRGAKMVVCGETTWSRGITSSLETQLNLDPSVKLSNVRATKIVATLGPASIDRLPELLQAGINVARINCAHGDAEQYKGYVDKVRKAQEDVRKGHVAQWKNVLGYNSAFVKAHANHTSSSSTSPSSTPVQLAGSRGDVCSIGLDIKGPEIRVGKLQGGKAIPLAKGDRLLLTTDPSKIETGSKEGGVYISYTALPKVAEVGQTVYIDDGNVDLRIVSIDKEAGTLIVESRTNHPLGERKNVNLPGMDVDLPAVTLKDERDIKTAKALGADIVFASFVQSADAVRQIRRLVGPDIRIISKIESQQGIDKYDEILSASDGIMVARGDLGVQIPAERVFLAQKMMIAKANVAGKQIICATQMLDSMITNPRPTRAEIVDVASAVLDGADAVMLSGETARGQYPLEAVQVMSRTCLAAEAAYPSRGFFTALSDSPLTPISVDADEAILYHETRMAKEWLAYHASGGHESGSGMSDGTAGPLQFMTAADVETLASSAVHAAWETNAAAIIVLCSSGRTASMLCKYRPSCPVICVTTDEGIARQLQMSRGAQVALLPPGHDANTAGALTGVALRLCKEWNLGASGQRVVVVHGGGGSDGGVAGVAVSLTQLR